MMAVQFCEVGAVTLNLHSAFGLMAVIN